MRKMSSCVRSALTPVTPDASAACCRLGPERRGSCAMSTGEASVDELTPGRLSPLSGELVSGGDTEGPANATGDASGGRRSAAAVSGESCEVHTGLARNRNLNRDNGQARGL